MKILTESEAIFSTYLSSVLKENRKYKPSRKHLELQLQALKREREHQPILAQQKTDKKIEELEHELNTTPPAEHAKEMLSRGEYGEDSLFTKDQLLDILLSEPLLAFEYVLETKERWPDLEDIILSKVDIATRKTHERMEEAIGEEKVYSPPRSVWIDKVYEYCNEIIKDRWPEVEKILLQYSDILMDAESCIYYAITVLKKRWPEFEATLIDAINYIEHSPISRYNVNADERVFEIYCDDVVYYIEEFGEWKEFYEACVQAGPEFVDMYKDAIKKRHREITNKDAYFDHIDDILDDD